MEKVFKIGSEWKTKGGHKIKIISVNEDQGVMGAVALEEPNKSCYNSIYRYDLNGKMIDKRQDAKKFDIVEPWEDITSGTFTFVSFIDEQGIIRKRVVDGKDVDSIIRDNLYDRSILSIETIEWQEGDSVVIGSLINFSQDNKYRNFFRCLTKNRVVGIIIDVDVKKNSILVRMLNDVGIIKYNLDGKVVDGRATASLQRFCSEYSLEHCFGEYINDQDKVYVVRHMDGKIKYYLNRDVGVHLGFGKAIAKYNINWREGEGLEHLKQ